jgi:hypothetical protein
MTDTSLLQRIQMLEDRAALKALVDRSSNLADTRDIDKQVLLFTEDARVNAYSDGKLTTALQGRQHIGDAFLRFLSQFETVYHLNGQQTVEIAGDGARGTAYCLVVLIGHEDGRRVRTTMGVTYHDTYLRHDGAWLIATRISNFAWSRREVVIS